MAGEFHCTVVTPQQKLLEQEVSYASIPAWDGQIGIQDRRSPLLVKLGFGRLRLQLRDGSEAHYFIGGGFAQMKGEKLTLLTDEAVETDQLDAETARAELKEAQAHRAAGDEQIDKRQRQIDRARAMTQLAGRS